MLICISDVNSYQSNVKVKKSNMERKRQATIPDKKEALGYNTRQYTKQESVGKKAQQ